jgi:hypothetical protein
MPWFFRNSRIGYLRPVSMRPENNKVLQLTATRWHRWTISEAEKYCPFGKRCAANRDNLADLGFRRESGTVTPRFGK